MNRNARLDTRNPGAKIQKDVMTDTQVASLTHQIINEHSLRRVNKKYLDFFFEHCVENPPASDFEDYEEQTASPPGIQTTGYSNH